MYSGGKSRLQTNVYRQKSRLQIYTRFHAPIQLYLQSTLIEHAENTLSTQREHSEYTQETLTSLVERTYDRRTQFCSLLDLPCSWSPTKSPIGPLTWGVWWQAWHGKQEPADRKKPTTRVVNLSSRRRNVISKAAKYAFLVLVGFSLCLMIILMPWVDRRCGI